MGQLKIMLMDHVHFYKFVLVLVVLCVMSMGTEVDAGKFRITVLKGFTLRVDNKGLNNSSLHNGWRYRADNLPNSDCMNNQTVPRNSRLTFCIEDHNYPQQLVERLLSENVQLYHGQLTNDRATSPDLLSRRGYIDEDTFCDYQETRIYPRRALSRQNKWLTVVNYKDFTQSIRVEYCVNEGEPCNYRHLIRDGVETFCKTKYIYRQLLSVNEDEKLEINYFLLPYCCKCYYKMHN